MTLTRRPAHGRTALAEPVRIARIGAAPAGALSPDGTVAALWGTEELAGEWVAVHSVKPNRLLALVMSQETEVHDVVLSPAGSRLGIVGPGSAEVWTPRIRKGKGQPRLDLLVERHLVEGITRRGAEATARSLWTSLPTPALTFSPDEQQVALCAGESEVSIHSLRRPSLRAIDWTPLWPVTAVAFLPVGRRLACGHDQGGLVIRDLDAVKPTASGEWPGHSIGALTAGKDRLVALDGKGKAALFRTRRHQILELVAELPSRAPIGQAVFLAGGRLLATRSRKRIDLWSLDGRPVASAATRHVLVAIAATADGTLRTLDVMGEVWEYGVGR